MADSPAERFGAAAEGPLGLGERLIFLVGSDPGGVESVRRLLASHPRIDARFSTPLLLHPAYALDAPERGFVSAPYFHSTLRLALEDFLATQARGRDTWMRAMRAFAGELYGPALALRPNSLLLDSNPSYTRILTPLREAFPAARFLFLLRDPRSALAAAIARTPGGDPELLHLARWNLLAAPGALAAAIDAIGPRGLAVRQESLADDPSALRGAICDFLGISSPFDGASVATDAAPPENDLAIDPAFVAEYLESLGGELVATLGYAEGADVARRREGRRPFFRLSFGTAVTSPDERRPWQRIQVALWRCRRARSLRPLLRWIRRELGESRTRRRELAP
jgi:hypothetical protein